jgi:hypothetical protein
VVQGAVADDPPAPATFDSILLGKNLQMVMCPQNRNQMSYSASQIGQIVSYWFQLWSQSRQGASSDIVSDAQWLAPTAADLASYEAI